MLQKTDGNSFIATMMGISAIKATARAVVSMGVLFGKAKLFDAYGRSPAQGLLLGQTSIGLLSIRFISLAGHSEIGEAETLETAGEPSIILKMTSFGCPALNPLRCFRIGQANIFAPVYIG